jgi:hypothetical protein
MSAWKPIERVVEGDVVVYAPHDRRIPCKVLRVEPGVETVTPLAGRPCIRLWVYRTDGEEGDRGTYEGYLTYGPGAEVLCYDD